MQGFNFIIMMLWPLWVVEGPTLDSSLKSQSRPLVDIVRRDGVTNLAKRVSFLS